MVMIDKTSIKCPCFLILVGLLMTSSSGCMTLGGWVNDYHGAEQLQRKDNRDILFFYKDYLEITSGDVHTVLKSSAVKDATEGMVRCILVTDYEPDRAYVAQFGIRRAPSVVVLRTDGTYHAQTGPMSQQDVLDLLVRAKSPGNIPKLDPYILRPVTYRWFNSLSPARTEAQRTGKPLLIFLKWWLSSPSMTLQRTLEQQEVNHALANFIHCRLEYDYLPNRTAMQPYGVTKPPSLVIVQPDGSYSVMDGPASSEAIVRFAQSHTTTDNP